MEIYIIIILTIIGFFGFNYIIKGRKIKNTPIIYPIKDEITDCDTCLLILNEMNSYRRLAGVKPLVSDDFTTCVADIRVEDMISLDMISHEKFPIQASKLLNLGAEVAGENLAYGYATVEGVCTAWYKSPGHKKNMLNPNYDFCGIAVKDKYFVVFFGGDDKIN